MSAYVLCYRVPKTPLREALGQLDEAAQASRLAAWRGWFESMGERVVDRGQPIGDAHEVGNCGPETRVGGYSVVAADTLEEAIKLANGCPGLEWGGGVEVGEIVELPPASSARDREKKPSVA